MCGISGIVNLSGAQAGLIAAARAMNAAIRHRGPDGEGFLVVDHTNKCIPAFSDETPSEISSAGMLHSPAEHIGDAAEKIRLIFGHRRLSIIDLSPGGHQPLCTADGRFWITYNGELYNYPELRKELEQSGSRFLTQTDTEVILQAYQRWGSACLDRFNGMWAFVIYDKEKQLLFGSRDRFGVKPFYYYHDARVFAFASEQKALLQNPFVKTSLNISAVSDYFISGEIEYAPESFFAGISELFPGCAFELDMGSGAFREWKYYTLSFNENFEPFDQKTYEKHTAHIRTLLEDAVRIRLRSDVPVGSCLSGGLDSSAIAGIISAQVGKDERANIGGRLKLFTATFNDPSIDESRWAKEMVNRTGAEWHTVNPGPDELLRDLENLVRCQDVPIWSTSTYAQYRVMQLVKDNGIRVVLDGQGGDELFAGYYPYYVFYWSELLRNMRWGALAGELNGYGSFGGALKYWTREGLKQKTMPSLSPSRQLKVMRSYFPDLQYIAPELTDSFLQRRKSVSAPRTLNGKLHEEFALGRLKGYLKCEDRCSMWHSVESRTPFSDDYKLIEYLFQVPAAYKIRKSLNKSLLREAAAPYLPDSIRTRRDKLGYATPNNKWITQIRDQVRPYFEQDFNGIIDSKALLRDYDKLFNVENQPENGRIFKFIAFAVWRKVFAV
ncbi:MAG: asparagine synthase (glutamine-hydrolysing) [Bacteroidetes bacterium]|nr:MAG: asparagine synthase (glutamine-hydrolysing) [Bacteroidota bacterium]